MTNQLKDDLIHLKGRLETIESQLTGQMKEIQTREDKWASMDQRAEKIYDTQTNTVRFNVGGRKFATSAKTLLATPETLLCKLVESGRVDLSQEIFFDRSFKMFPYILDYLRTKTLNYRKFSKEELIILNDDAEYYGIDEISEYLGNRLKEIELVDFEYSGAYIYNGQTAGNGEAKDLSDKSMNKGICATSPSWILFTLNCEFEFESLEIGGWKGNASIWYSDNGAGAKILTSNDKETWTNVGAIPYGFGNSIATVKLTRSSAKYIKFEHTSYLGIGYLKIKKIEDNI